MKVLITSLVLIICFFLLYVYGMMPRKHTVDYDALADVQLHNIICIDEKGNLNTYAIPMPSFEGFSEEDAFELSESYAQSFCDSLGEIDND